MVSKDITSTGNNTRNKGNRARWMRDKIDQRQRGYKKRASMSWATGRERKESMIQGVVYDLIDDLMSSRRQRGNVKREA